MDQKPIVIVSIKKSFSAGFTLEIFRAASEYYTHKKVYDLSYNIFYQWTKSVHAPVRYWVKMKLRIRDRVIKAWFEDPTGSVLPMHVASFSEN